MKLSVSMTREETVFGWLYLAIHTLILPALLVNGNLFFGSPLSDSLLNFLMFSINFIAVILIFHRFLQSSLRDALHTPWRCLRFAFLGLMLNYLGSFLVKLLIQTVCPDFSNVNNQNILSMAQDHYVLMTLGTVFLVPVAEETLYRGLIFRCLYEKSPVLGYCLSTLAFSALHVVNYVGRYSPVHLLLCLLQYVPASLALAFAYAKADNIWAPVLIHITVNQVSILSAR